MVELLSRASRVALMAFMAAALAAGGVPAPGRAAQDEAPPAESPPTEEAESPEGDAAQEGEEATPDDGAAEEEARPALELPKKLSAWVPPEKRAKAAIEIACDAPCVVLVGGEELGTLPEGGSGSFEVPVGDQRIKARSVTYPNAEWEKVVKVREGRNRSIDVKMAKAISDLHRREQHRGVYRDEKRELIWTRRDNGSDVRWQGAAAYCESLVLGGWQDWRLPTLEELESLRSLWSQSGYKIVGGIALTGCCPWSADLEGEARAWNYNFRHRRRFLGHRSYALDQRALCVRPLDDTDGEEAAGEPAEPEAEAGSAGPSGGEGFPGPSPSHW